MLYLLLVNFATFQWAAGGGLRETNFAYSKFVDIWTLLKEGLPEGITCETSKRIADSADNDVVLAGGSNLLL